MEWAALITWVVTALFGFTMLAIWFRHGGHAGQRGVSKIRPWSPASATFRSPQPGLVLWIVYLSPPTADALAWIAFVVLLPVVAVLGWTMFFGLGSAAEPSVAAAPAGAKPPAPLPASGASRFRSSCCTALFAVTTVVLVLADGDRRRRLRRPQIPTSIGAGGGPCSSSSRSRSRQRSRHELFLRRLELGERPPADVVHVLRGEVDRRRRLVLVDAHEVDPLALAVDPAVPREGVIPRPDLGPELELDEPGLLGELAADRLLGGSRPRRRRRRESPTSVWPVVSRNCTSSVRSWRSSTSARAARRSTGSSQSWSARNQRSRSAYGTAAFAGDVDGSTKRPTSPSVAVLRAELGPRRRTAPRYASLPTNAIARGRARARSRSSRSREPAKSPRRRSPEPGVVR